MAKIPFDIKYKPQIESGEYKVYHSNGNTVRILAWDLPGDYPIAAADWPRDCETDIRVETYTEDGWDGIGRKAVELMVETKRIKLPLDILRKWSMQYSPNIRDMIEDTACHFWNLAMEERQAEIEFRGEEYKQGYEDGRKEALENK